MKTQSTNGEFMPGDIEFFFEQSLCGFIIADPEGIIIRANSRICTWSGFNVAELKGKRFTDLLAIGGKIYYETHLWPMLRMQGFFDEVVLELGSAEKAKLRVMVNAVECRDKDNKVLCIHYTIVKATDRLLYEQNLQLAKAMAEKDLLSQKEMVTLREQLIAVLGHDLRNPLSAVRMATDMLQHTQLNIEEAEIISIIKRSNSRMTELVSSIMDFARTRLGDGLVVKRKDALLTPVLEHVISELQLVHPERKIIATFNITEPVHCDADRIAQLLSNLLANALTHGSADSTIYVHGFHENGSLELSVTNNGEPIPQRLLEKLFTPFTREESRPSQNGLGLGLYICDQIARAHDARLTCVSTTEETRFTFYMPA